MGGPGSSHGHPAVDAQDMTGHKAAAGTEQEELEAFVLAKIQAGAPLRGAYPPGPETRAEFEAARRARG